MLFILISPELLFLVSSALRGASSKKKKNSLHAAKSASQEVLSTSREEKEQKKKEKKAQSMEHLDGNRKIGTKLTHAHARAHTHTLPVCLWLMILSPAVLVFISSKQPDLLPASVVTLTSNSVGAESRSDYQ